MGMFTNSKYSKYSKINKYRKTAFLIPCILLAFYLASCQNTVTAVAPSTAQAVPSPTPTTQDQGSASQLLHRIGGIKPGAGTFARPVIQAGPKQQPTAKPTPPPTTQPTSPATHSAAKSANERPLLAFYYPWYSQSTWCSCHMSDLPTIQYNSSDDATIDRQLTWASNVGISGFISSWWGAGDHTDTNFAKLLAHSATLENNTGYHFTSTIYFESDAPALSGTSAIVGALRYILATYGNDQHFFHWQGKPVLFFWDPLGQGRTLAEWASIRSQVDPNNQTIWSAEGVDMNLLNVFEGIHLFSAGYWGIQHNDMSQVNQGFHNQINTYNSANNTHKIWAAGVMPGYDDTRVPGRTGAFVVPRNNGATYTTSWQGALASQPDWITITSFNEWFEGSMIEPSGSYGNLYLALTQQFATQWRS